MKVQKIKAGTYKITTNKGIFMVRGGANYNSDSYFFKKGGYEIWTADSDSECTDLNCWSCGASSKKTAIRWIKEWVHLLKTLDKKAY